jgi:hypothetical protein
MGVYSSGMQDALRRLANQKPNLSRLTFSQQKLADSLLQAGMEDGFFVHEGQKHPLPPEPEAQRYCALQITGRL